jgi:hypothetical protein
MKNTLFKKGLVIGIIILFIGVSVLSSVSSKDVSVFYDRIVDNNNEIEQLDTIQAIYTKINICVPEGYVVTVKESGIGILFRYVEIWSEVGFDISGYYLDLIIPKYFSKTVRHIIAPRCFVYIRNAYFPGFGEMTQAFAIGNIEWE